MPIVVAGAALRRDYFSFQFSSVVVVCIESGVELCSLDYLTPLLSYTFVVLIPDGSVVELETAWSLTIGTITAPSLLSTSSFPLLCSDFLLPSLNVCSTEDV